jgi:tRNA U38,U39,U40 pseudouridine synthase TruA
MGDAPDEHEKVRAMFAGRPTMAAEAVADALGSIQPPGFRLRVAGPAEDTFTARFTRAGRRITYVVNNGSAPASPRLESKGGGRLTVTVYDPLDGSIKPLPVPDTAVIKPYASLIFVE